MFTFGILCGVYHARGLAKLLESMGYVGFLAVPSNKSAAVVSFLLIPVHI